MSNTDFDELLRESLRARAQDVTPDPETWNRVQAGVRKRQQLRWALAGVTAAAAVVLAAVALPSLLTSTRVDLTPAEQVPDGTGILRDVELGGYLVHTEGETRVVDLDVELVAGGGTGPQAALAPGSTTFTYVVTGGCERTTTTFGSGEVASAPIPGLDTCPIGVPHYSTDGGFLLWLERPGGQWVIRYLSVTDGVPDGRQEGRLALPGADRLEGVRLHDVTVDQATTDVLIRVAGTDAGVRSLHRTQLSRPTRRGRHRAERPRARGRGRRAPPRGPRRHRRCAPAGPRLRPVRGAHLPR